MSNIYSASHLNLILNLAMEKEDENSSPINNNNYYRAVLPKISEGKVVSWNWSAGIFGISWLLYRRMYFIACLMQLFLVILFYIESIFLGVLSEGLTYCSTFFLSLVLCGSLGNWFYYKSLSHRLRKGYHLISTPSTDIWCALFGFPLALMISVIHTIRERRKIGFCRKFVKDVVDCH